MRFLILPLLLSLGACFQYTNSVSGDVQRFGSNVTGSDAFLSAREVFQNKCFECHGDWATLNETDFTTYAPSGEVLVQAGDAVNSLIYYRIRGSSGPKGPKTMPNSGAQISSQELETIEDWITNYAE
jgi:hypothetical protein